MKHGMHNTKLWRAWRHMRQRCYYLKSDNYQGYGGRGIIVCAEWKEDFRPFRDWALINGYEDGLTLDRINVNGNYEPGNCKWSTALEQQRNRRDTVPDLTIFNETKHPMDWSRDPRCKVSYLTLRERVAKGMPPELALTTPPRWKKAPLRNSVIDG